MPLRTHRWRSADSCQSKLRNRWWTTLRPALIRRRKARRSNLVRWPHHFFCAFLMLNLMALIVPSTTAGTSKPPGASLFFSTFLNKWSYIAQRALNLSLRLGRLWPGFCRWREIMQKLGKKTQNKKKKLPSSKRSFLQWGKRRSAYVFLFVSFLLIPLNFGHS